MNLIEEIREPIIRANILTPPDYVGNVITLCEEKRGVQIGIQYMGSQVQISYELPMAEVVLDFFDKLKSVSRGYASLDYHFLRFEAGPFVRVDTLINGDKVDALSHHRAPQPCRPPRPRPVREDEGTDPAADVRRGDPGRRRLADHRPLARSRRCARTCWPSATAATSRRKKKLLEKQKEGKKRMKQVGRVEIPQEAFLAVLQVDNK